MEKVKVTLVCIPIQINGVRTAIIHIELDNQLDVYDVRKIGILGPKRLSFRMLKEGKTRNRFR